MNFKLLPRKYTVKELINEIRSILIMDEPRLKIIHSSGKFTMFVPTKKNRGKNE